MQDDETLSDWHECMNENFKGDKVRDNERYQVCKFFEDVVN